MSDPTRTTQIEETLLVIDDVISEIQRGYFRKPSFYNDISQMSSHSSFISGVNTALDYAGNIALKSELVDEREEGSVYRLTKAEYTELEKKAKSISNYSNVPYETCEDFLVILCFVNNITDMQTIANAVQVPELNDRNILRKPMFILSISRLEKIAFAASALDGLINMFKKYLNAADSISNKSSSGSDISSVLSAIGGAVSGMGSVAARLEIGTSEDALGNFMSELITGKRIPMTVIAKNPMMQLPSYVGKAFFGESPNPLSLVDIDQIFNKKIAAFPQITNGAGTSAFGFQNMGSLAQGMSLQSVVSKVLTGNASVIEGTKKARQVAAAVDKINTLIGTTSDTTVEMRRADNALPMMSALSAVLSGTDKTVFSSSSFQEGWVMANSVSNHLLDVKPNFIEAVRNFL